MTTPTPNREEWRTRFDKEFHFSDAENEINIAGTELAGQLKSFIQKEIETVREETIKEVVERIEGMKKEQLDKNDPDNYGACYAIAGHNRALETLKVALLNK